MERLIQQECVYCGATSDLTAEHSPPKLLFPKPWPSDLITVPACLACNQAGQADAEYFRACLCMSPRTRDSRAVADLRPALSRSFERPQAAGFRMAFLEALRPLKGAFELTVEIARMHVVVERTVQCLYLHETGKRLNPVTHELTALGDDYLSQFSPEEVEEFQRNFVIPLSDPTVIGDNAFAYASIHTSRDSVSAWGLMFYGAFPFVALTGPRKRPLKQGKA